MIEVPALNNGTTVAHHFTCSVSWNPGVSTTVKFAPVPTQGPTAYVVSLVQELPPPLIKKNFEDYSNSVEKGGLH